MHISGSLVLMADYSWKDNDKIRKGDIILGADLISATVTETNIGYTTNMRIMSFLETPIIRFTEFSCVWAKDISHQWWWVENATRLQHAWRSRGNKEIGLKIIDSFLVDYEVEFATLNGFEKKTIIDASEDYEKNTIIPFFSTDRFCPVIINGYVVAQGRINEYVYDYTKFNWLDSYNQLIQSDKLELIKRNLLK